mgnify:CR=1 FL=1
MRVLFACLTLLPTAALADVFTLRSEPQAVTVYPYLATVHRQATVTLPRGAHQIVLPDLPHTMDREYLRVSVMGATLGTTQFRNCLLYTSPSPRDLSTSRMPSSA